MGRLVIVLIAVIGAAFVGFAGYQAREWLAPSIEHVDRSRGLGDPNAAPDAGRPQDESHDITGS